MILKLVKNTLKLPHWLLPILIGLVILTSGCSDKSGDTKDQPQNKAKSTGLVWKKQAHFDAVTSLVFSPDGQFIVSGADAADDNIQIWKTDTGAIIKTLLTDTSWMVALSPDGKRLAGGARGTINIWNIDDGKKIGTIENVSTSLRQMCISPDGKILASGGLDGFVALWDFDLHTNLKTIEINGYCWTMAFSPDGSELAVGGNPDVQIINVATGKTTRTLKTYAEDQQYDANIDTFALVFTPDGTSLITGGADQTLRIWSRETGTVTQSFQPEQAVIKSLAISPDGKRLAIGTFMDLSVLDLETGAITPILPSCKPINTIAFSPDGTKLAYGSDDQTVSLWKLSGPAQP